MLISQADSLLYQSVSMCMLLAELSHKKFLESDFYKDHCFQKENSAVKEILSNSGGIGNPATLQTMLYLLLVCPRESLSETEKQELDQTVNDFCKKLNPSNYNSSYSSDRKSVDFSRHLRNAIAHSLCEYPSAGKMVFRDTNPLKAKETFEIKIDSNNIEQLLASLQMQIINFLNKRNHPKK